MGSMCVLVSTLAMKVMRPKKVREIMLGTMNYSEQCVKSCFDQYKIMLSTLDFYLIACQQSVACIPALFAYSWHGIAVLHYWKKQKHTT